MSTTHPSEPSRFLNVDEAADYLNVSPWTIRGLIKSGALPSHRFGRYLRVTREALDQLAADSATPAVDGPRG